MIDMLRSLHEQAAPFLVAQVWPMVWQSSLLIALVAIANRTVFRRASAQLRYTLWVLVLVRLLLPPSLEVPTSIRHWGTPRVERYATAMVSKAATPGPTALFESYNAQAIAVESVEAARGPAAIAPVPMPAAARPWWASMLAAVWIAGVAVLVTVLLARLTRYRRMLREASPPPDWVCVMLEEYRERMKLRLPVDVRVVRSHESPALIGLGRLTILLPAHSLASLSAEQLRAVIVHELAHAKRLDFLVNWVQVVLGIAYFFHPLVWFANRQMRIEREHACDDLALITLGLNRKGYADSLLRIAETAAAPHRFAPVQLGVVETRSNLAKRLRRILDQGLRPAPRLTVMSIVIVVAFASVFGTWHYSQAAPVADTEAAAPKPPAACATSTDDPFAIPVTETSLPTRFEGRVLDESNRPLAGVHVDAWTWCPGNETETAKDGAFVLEFDDDRRNIEVRFSKAGYSPVYMYYQPVGALCEPIVMTTRTYFEGAVTGSDGHPVADAIVRADAGPRHADGVFLTDTATEVRTAADGSFHFPVQHDTYTIIVTAGAESAVVRDVAIAQFEAERLDIALQPSPTFRARVIDSISKKPVAGVRLGNWRFKEIGGVSDAQGRVAIAGIPEGEFEFNVDAHELGYARWWSAEALREWERDFIEQDGRRWQRNFDGLTFTIGSDAPEVTIVVEQCARVQGMVVDPEGNAVAGATVAPALTGTGNSITGDTRFSVQTDEHGAFDMLLPASKIREYNLIAHDGKYEEWRQWANGVMEPIATQPGDVVDNVVIQMQSPCVVRGIAVDENGAPAAQREVRAASADKTDNRYFVPTTRTDDDGRFELQYVAEGTHFVQVAPFWLDPEEAPEGTSITVETSPEHAVEGVELIAQAR